MTLAAIYLFLIAVLSNYRHSKHWPQDLKAFGWLNKFWAAVTMLIGTVLLVLKFGVVLGFLYTLTGLLTTLSIVILSVNLGRRFCMILSVLFNVVFLLVLIIQFFYAG